MATPNIGQIVLMLPVQMKYAQPTTITRVEISEPGTQSFRPNGFHRRPPNSWSTKRPIRVPASMVVRMKTASNMMAK